MRIKERILTPTEERAVLAIKDRIERINRGCEIINKTKLFDDIGILIELMQLDDNLSKKMLQLKKLNQLPPEKEVILIRLPKSLQDHFIDDILYCDPKELKERVLHYMRSRHEQVSDV